MYCSQCGTKNALDVKLCGNCGEMTGQGSPTGNFSNPTYNPGASGAVAVGKKNYTKWLLVLGVVGVTLFVLFNAFGGSSMPRGRFYPVRSDSPSHIIEFHGRGQATISSAWVASVTHVTYHIRGNRLIITEEVVGGVNITEYALSRDRRSFSQATEATISALPDAVRVRQWMLQD